MADPALIVPVILSGGAGTRLWPLSDRMRPKQFHALVGENSMLQQTALRVFDPALFAPPVVIGSADHRALLAAQLAEAGIAPQALVLEPCPRNTAPAIALAALAAAADSVLIVLPSDHVIQRPDALIDAVRTGLPLARDGWLVTFGIRPAYAETGFGYIRRGEALGDAAFRVERFVEKPDAATARAYVEDGGYDWNGGIFMFRASRLIEALRAHAPEILAAAERAMAGAEREGAALAPDRDAFVAAPSLSIDYAVMEKDDRVAVVPVEMGWSDIGSWDALYDIAASEAGANVTAGPARLIDAQGCLVRSDGLEVVAIGVQDLIIVASGGKLLILPRGQSQRAREALD